MYASLNTAASALAKTGATGLAAVILTGGSDAATATVYDNTTNSGTVLCKLAAAAGLTATFCPCGPLAAARGLYVVITGTAASCTLVFG